MANNPKVTIALTPARYRVRRFNAKGEMLEESWCNFTDSALETAEKMAQKAPMTRIENVPFGKDV